MKELKIPNHIAFIMDGNGRWAKARMLPRKMGHREGVKALKRVIDACESMGIGAVTFYAFSTENWGRPQSEINALFSMIKQFTNKELETYSEKNCRIRFLGDTSALPDDVKESIIRVENKVCSNDGMMINIALNYGGRDEIVYAVDRLVKDGAVNVTKELLESYLYTAGIPDPDILVRSSGEKRVSNFLLWQIAYSELIFIDENWPDFNEKTVGAILEEYSKRDRRFGKVRRS